MTRGSFLQGGVGTAQRNAVMNSEKVSNSDHSSVLSFLSGGTSDGRYASQSGEIDGNLKQLVDEMSAGLRALEAEELDWKLMKPKVEEIFVLTKTIEEKTVRAETMAVEVEKMRSEFFEAEMPLLADRVSAFKLNGSCVALSPQWEECQRLRVEELVAICDTIKLPNEETSPDIADGMHVGKYDLDDVAYLRRADDEAENAEFLTGLMTTRLEKKLSDVRKNGDPRWSYPDGKTQVAIQHVQGTNKSLDPGKICTVVTHATRAAAQEQEIQLSAQRVQQATEAQQVQYNDRQLAEQTVHERERGEREEGEKVQEEGEKGKGGKREKGRKAEEEGDKEVKKDVMSWTVVTRNKKQKRRMVQIFVKVNESKTFPLDVSPDDKVNDVIKQIQKEEDVYVTMHGKVLRRNEKLKSCGVSDGCTIQVMSRLNGGGKHKDKKSKAEKKQVTRQEPVRNEGPAILESEKEAVIRVWEETEEYRAIVENVSGGSDVDVERKMRYWASKLQERPGGDIMECGLR